MSSGRRAIDRWFSAEAQYQLEPSEISEHIQYRLRKNHDRLASAEARAASLERRREVADSPQSTGHQVQHFIRWCSRMLELEDTLIADLKSEIALLEEIGSAF